jgi:adenine-specific DNA-methyltransferase
VRGIEHGLSYYKAAGDLFQNGSVDLERSDKALLDKLATNPPLAKLGNVRQGIAENPATINKKTNKAFGNRWHVGQGVFMLNDMEFNSLELSENELEIVVPYHDLKDVGRYYLAAKPSLRLIYSTRETWPALSDFPQLRAHMQQFSPIMKRRRETVNGSNKWWHLHWPRDAEMWEAPKIICLQMMQRPSFAYAKSRCYVPFSANVFYTFQTTRESLGYITALLNSRVLWMWFHHRAKRRGIALEINGGVLSRAPIRRINFRDPSEVALHDTLVKYCDKMESLSKQIRRINSSVTEQSLRMQFDALDTAVDRIVYELYGLTATEMVEVERLNAEFPKHIASEGLFDGSASASP